MSEDRICTVAGEYVSKWSNKQRIFLGSWYKTFCCPEKTEADKVEPYQNHYRVINSQMGLGNENWRIRKYVSQIIVGESLDGPLAQSDVPVPRRKGTMIENPCS